MTILTKPFSEKKGIKEVLAVPLVSENKPVYVSDDVEALKVRGRIIVFPAHARRISSSTMLCLLIIALAGVSVGMIGGKILYNEYLSVTRKPMQGAYQKSPGWVKIPMSQFDNEYVDVNEEVDMTMKMLNDQDLKNSIDIDDWKKNLDKNFFQENFEIDAENKYEKIDVPDFRNGRNGRFIHDFNTNYTGIIDVTGSRCFVMPLNRANVLPPTSLFDLVHKMWDGYYKVNTEVVRETMKVETPPITDTSVIGHYIAAECANMPIYKLEKFVGGVVKRSANSVNEMKFGQFAGEGILELDIVNMDAVLDYEKEKNRVDNVK